MMRDQSAARDSSARTRRLASDAGSRMTRLLRHPAPLRVREDAAGLPTSIELFGHSCEIQVIERWRISERWWPDPIDRDYLRISGPGWLALIFHDLLAGGWFLERVYD